MNQSEGEFRNYPLANRKTSLTILGPSPRYFWTNSDPTTRINDAVVWWATAFANIVWKLWRHVRWRHLWWVIVPFRSLVDRTWGHRVVDQYQFACRVHNESVEVQRLHELLVSECPNHQYRWNESFNELFYDVITTSSLRHIWNYVPVWNVGLFISTQHCNRWVCLWW